MGSSLESMENNSITSDCSHVTGQINAGFRQFDDAHK